MLLVGDSGYNSRASLNQDFALVADEFDQALAFQMDVWVDTGNDSSWSSVAIGSGQGLNADSPGAKFAIRPMRNNTLQIWVNGSQVASASRSGNNFRIILSDTAGSGSAFDGNGSKAALFNGATLVGIYTLPQLSSGDGYLTFGAQPDSGYHITRVDNLNISRVIVTPPPAILTWQGNTDSDYNTGANYTENGWGQWTDYVFDSNVVNGTLNVDDYTGWGNLSLNSGLSTDITIGGSSPIIMAPAKLGQSGWDFPSLGGTMTLASDSRNLTINTGLIIAGELVWDVGSGRTLTANGSIQNWTDNGIASLRKEGTGTANLSVSNNFTGGTIINSGTLRATRGSLGTGSVTVNHGGTLYVNDQWVLCGVNPYNVATGDIGSLTINAGGTLQFDAVQGFANGATNLFLNGGLVTGGPNDFRADLFLFNGNQQITAGGATTSTIATIIGVTGNNNTVTVAADSMLNLTSGIKNADWFSNGTSPGGIIKAGPGTLTLAANCSYSGTTDITGGTLQVGAGGASGSLGSGAVSIASDAKLSFNRSDTLTTSQNFSGEGTIAQEGTGTLIVNSDIASITHVVVNNGLLRTDFFRQWNSNLNLTVNATGVFEMWNTTTTIANLSGNGTIRNSANWSGYAAGSPAATNNLTIAAGNFTGTITDNGFGDGGTTGTTGDTRISLFKASNATLILSGNTSYGGNTTIQAGTLRLGNGTAPTNLANSADVIVAAGAMLHLDYSGTDQIRSLWVDGHQMPAGIYSSTSGFISGAGTLTVTTGPASADFAVWAGRGMHNLTGGPYADDDNDGVPNLLEYVLGGNPNAHSRTILPTTRISAGNLVFSFDRVQSTTADTVQVFEHSSNLSDWTSVPMSNEAMIHIEPDTAHVGMEKVTITIPLVNSDHLFGRLRITQSQTSSDD
jgi:autotransporter-associated beta strand protein